MFPQDNFFNSDHSSTPAVDGDVAAPPSTSYTPEFSASRQSVSRSPEDFGTSSHISLGDTNFNHSSVTESSSSSLTRKGKGADNGGGDTMTARRREANRLAAQRFRSRKKGYQDSLEEKIKELEQENRALQGKLEGKNETPQRDPSSSSKHVSYDHYSWAANSHHAPPILPSSSAIRPDYIEVQHNHEFRIRHLEALNQALEEELREVREENKRLRDEFAHWRMATRDWSEEENNRPASSNEPPVGFFYNKNRPRNSLLTDKEKAVTTASQSKLDSSFSSLFILLSPSSGFTPTSLAWRTTPPCRRRPELLFCCQTP